MIAITGTLLIIGFISGIHTIAWFTSRIRALEKGKPYAGFLIEVLLKGGINNDFLPVIIHPPAESEASNYPLYKHRNLFVKFIWVILSLFIVSVITFLGEEK